MNRCINCNVWVVDESEFCPLCNSVLADEQEAFSLIENKEKERSFIDTVGDGAPYPDVRKRKQRLQFFLRLLLFVFLVVETVLFIINKMFLDASSGVWWSAICGVAMAYTYICMAYWINHDSGHARKIGLQLFLTIVLVLLIDYLTGKNGWSLEFAVPCIVLVGDGLVFLLMMTDRKQWYSYTLLLLLLALICGGIIICFKEKWITHIILVLFSVGVTFVFLLGTCIFGDRQITRELKRRFRV